MAYSFYGGKPGISYKIIAHFDSVYDMVTAFQQGGSFNEVNYGEYVIIDTIVNNHQYTNPENGLLYRRGLNYTENFDPNQLTKDDNHTVLQGDYYETVEEEGQTIQRVNLDQYYADFSNFIKNPGGGAQYVGQIVGPKGSAPQLTIVEWQEMLEKIAQKDDGYSSGTIILPPTPAVTFDQDGSILSIDDNLKYAYLDIKDEYDNIIGAYIAFDIPGFVFRYHAESIEPYDSGYATYNAEENIWQYAGLISEDEDSEGHPYFWQYDIKVPKGIKGQGLEEFDIDIDPTLISQDGNDILPGENDNNYRYYRIYRNYDRTAEGETTKQYLDSWQRTIHKITNNGVFPEYPLVQRNTSYNLNDRVAANGLKNHLCLLATTSGFTGSEPLPALETYQRGKTFTDGSVTWQVVEDIVTTPDLLTIHYTHGDNDEIKIRVVDDIICDNQNGRIYVKYSDLNALTYLGENQSIIGVDYVDTPWIDSTGMSHTIDRLCIKYNTYNYDDNGRIIPNSNFNLDENGNLIFPTTDASGRRIQYIDQQFKFLDRVQTDPSTKVVTAYYNDGTETTLGDLRSIGRVFIENETSLKEPSYLAVEYNNQLPDGTYQTDRFNDFPLNEIASIQQYGDNIIVLYSDETVRKNLYDASKDYAIANTLYDIPKYDKTTGNDDGNGNLYWINLGSIYKSNHIFSKFDSLTQLRSLYPYGFDKNTSGALVPNMKDFAGWVATIDDGQGNISTYAYDYRGTAGWYPLQDLSASNIDPTWVLLISKPDDQDDTKPPIAKDSLLNDKGYWFVVYERAD